MNASRKIFSLPISALLFAFSLTLACDVQAYSVEQKRPKIIIVLDDVGYRQIDTVAFSLPIEVAFSILPQTPYAIEYANRADAQGRDVMLHLPMASALDKALGPAALTVGMIEDDIERTLLNALASVPHAIGVNNHMGSALTELHQPMRSLMQALKVKSLFFLDSRTSPRSIAYETAKKIGLPTDMRHVFLDHEQTDAFYKEQFSRLIKIAKKHGRAIGIAHPYPTSLAFLSSTLPHAKQYGVVLEAVSNHFETHQPKRENRFLSESMVTAPSDD